MSTALTILVLVTIYGIASSSVRAQTNDRKFIDDARNSYSTLRRQGLIEIQASVDPNWELFFEGLTEKGKSASRDALRHLHFSVTADTTGKIKVTHQIEALKQDKETTKFLEDVAKKIEISVGGFLRSWIPFTLTSVIPEKLDHFVLQDLNSQYLLTFGEDAGEVNITITKDHEIREVKTSDGIVKPLLKRTEVGFVLTGYEANIDDTNGGRLELHANVELSDVEGMLLPRKVFLDGLADKTPVKVEFHFANYKLRKKT
jgi:hypothetical protein